jgi:phosphohistidine phosphatase
MRLLIVRHAIAVPRGTPGVVIEDDARPLTRRGVKRFRLAARGLARLLPPPDALLTSPLARARHTAELLAAAWGGVRVTDEPALAGGDLDALAPALDAHRRRGLVAIVGHEPHLSQALARLLGTGYAQRLEFRKGGAALVDLPGAFARGGALVWFLPPRVLRRLAR